MRISDWSSDVCSSDLKDGDWVGKGARRLLAVRMEYLAHFEPELCALSGLWRFVNSSQDEMEIGFAMMATCGLSGLEGKAESLRARSEEHTSELQSLMRISYAVFCLKKKNTTQR